MFIYLFLTLVCLINLSLADSLTISPCSNPSVKLDLTYNVCYPVKYKLVQANFSTVTCLFNEYNMNINTTINSLLCPNCTNPSDYTASMLLRTSSYLNAFTHTALFFNDLNCNQFSNNISFSILGVCTFCKDPYTTATYLMSHTFVNTSTPDSVSQSTSGILTSGSSISSGSSTDSSDSNSLPIILGVSLGSISALLLVGLIILACCVCIIICCLIFCCLLIVASTLFVLALTATGLMAAGATTGGTIIYKKKQQQIKIGDLVFIQQLGSGAGGNVFLALYHDEKVAVKEITLYNNDQNLIMNEIHLLLNLQGLSNVCQILDYVEDSDKMYIVTKYYEHGDLLNYLKGEQLSLEVKMKIILGIAKGLEHLHSHNIVHRDLSCRNILLDENLEAIITDFGFSRKFVMSSEEEAQRTTTNMLPIRWSAPESLKDKSFSYASDIFMFSRLIFEILAEEEPFKDMDILEVMSRVIHSKYNLNYDSLNISSEFKSLLIDMSNYDRLMRPSLTEVVRRLMEINANLTSYAPVASNDIYVGSDDIV